LKPLWGFAVHVFVGSLLFLIIATPAILLNWLVIEVEAYHHTDRAIIWAIRIAEYAILGADLLLSFIYLRISTKRSITELKEL